MTDTQATTTAFDRFVAQGGEAELRRVFDDSYAHLLRLAQQQGLDEATAEDAVQETFLVVLRRRHSFRSGSSFQAWVSAIVERVARSEQRRRQRHLAALRLVESDLDRDRERLPASAELEDKITRMVETLPEPQRDVVVALLLQGLSMHEVSSRLGLSRVAVSKRLSRALRKLRERLGVGAAFWLAARLTRDARGQEALWPRIAAASREPAKPIAASAGALTVACIVAVGAASIAIVQSFGRDANAAEPDHAELRTTAAAPTADRVDDVDITSLEADDAGERSAAEIQIDALEPTVDETSVDGVVGRVVDAQGRPAPEGLEVFVLESTPGLVAPDAPLVAAARTDATGGYVLPRESFADDETPLLLVRGAGMVAYHDCESLVNATRIPDIELVPAQTIDVEVVDEHGAPVAGATVVACVEGSRLSIPHEARPQSAGTGAVREHEFLSGVRTDDQGRARLDGLVPAERGPWLTVCAAWKPGHLSADRMFQRPEGNELACTLVLPSTTGKELTGTVVDDEGRRIEGVGVHVGYQGASRDAKFRVSKSGATGDWSIPLSAVEGIPCRLSFVREGYVTRDILLQSAEETAWFPLEVDLSRCVTVRGRVVDESGDPIANARVALNGPYTWRRARTNSDGRFGWDDCGAGVCTLVVDADDASGARLHEEMLVVDHGEDLLVRMPNAASRSGTIEVDFTWPDGEDESRIAEAVMMPIDVEDAPPRLMLEVTGDAKAAIDDVPAGAWNLFARDEKNRGLIQRIEVDGSGEAQSVAAEFVPPGAIEFVWDRLETEKPAGGLLTARLRLGSHVPIWLIGGSTSMTAIVQQGIGPDGVVRLEGLPPGTWEVVARDRGHVHEPALIDVTSGETTRADVQAEAAGSVLFVLPAVGFHSLCVLEVRRPGETEWCFQTYLNARADGLQSNIVPFAEGEWEWRITHRVYVGGGDPIHLIPPLTSTIDVVPGETLEVDACGRDDWIEAK